MTNQDEIDMDDDFDDDGDLDVEHYPIPGWVLRLAGEEDEA